MRVLFFITLAVFLSACIAQSGSYKQINMKKQPSDFLLALQYVKSNYQSECHDNGKVKIESVKNAQYQIVAGKNYKITFILENKSLLNVKVFQSLPNEKGIVHYEIDDCSN